MTDGIRTTVLGVDGVSEVEVQDDGFTGEPIPLWTLVPYGGTATTGATEREQAIRLATEALEVAKRTRDLAERREWECEAALLELHGEQPLYAALLRARLSGDAKAHHRARVEFYADLFLRNSTPPPLEIADAVTERVAALRILADKH